MDYEFPGHEALAALSKSDPDAVERIRKEAVESLIKNAPRSCQRRLRGLQFQIDMEVRRSKSPLDSCVRISSMMHESLERLRRALNLYDDEDARSPEQSSNAQIIPFRYSHVT